MGDSCGSNLIVHTLKVKYPRFALYSQDSSAMKTWKLARFLPNDCPRSAFSFKQGFDFRKVKVPAIPPVHEVEVGVWLQKKNGALLSRVGGTSNHI